MKNLSNPHVVQYIDVFSTDLDSVIIMEQCSGGNLRRHLHQLKKNGDSMTEEHVLKMAIQISIGLAYLHENKIVHRDIKAENILMTAEKTLKIADLGL